MKKILLIGLFAFTFILQGSENKVSAIACGSAGEKTPAECAALIGTTPGGANMYLDWAVTHKVGTPERDAMDQALSNWHYNNDVMYLTGMTAPQWNTANGGSVSVNVKCQGPCFAGGGKTKITPNKISVASGESVTFTLGGAGSAGGFTEAISEFDCSWAKNGEKQGSVVGKSFTVNTTNLTAGSYSITLSCLAGNVLPLKYVTSDPVVITVGSSAGEPGQLTCSYPAPPAGCGYVPTGIPNQCMVLKCPTTDIVTTTTSTTIPSSNVVCTDLSYYMSVSRTRSESDTNYSMGQSTDNNTEGEVTQLQTFLKAKGYIASSISTTGKFGPATRAGVKKFQADNNISQTGSTGPLTRTKISSVSGCDSSTTSGD